MTRPDHQLSRRAAIARLAALAAVPSALPRALDADDASGPAAPIARPGLQLYTVRDQMKASVERTLAKVAELGYKEVEFAGYFGKTPVEIASLLKANGLTSPSSHINIARMRTSPTLTLDEAAAAGHRYVTVAWVGPNERTADGYKRLAADFNTFGAAAKKQGLAFAYHNHDFEFATVGGAVAFDTLLAGTDPSLVWFELDLFWVTKGGKRAVEYMERFPGRLPMVHVKDMAADGAMVDVGAGTIDFPAIFRAAKGGIKHYFVEHDSPKEPFVSIGVSIAYLRGLK